MSNSDTFLKTSQYYCTVVLQGKVYSAAGVSALKVVLW